MGNKQPSSTYPEVIDQKVLPKATPKTLENCISKSPNFLPGLKVSNDSEDNYEYYRAGIYSKNTGQLLQSALMNINLSKQTMQTNVKLKQIRNNACSVAGDLPKSSIKVIEPKVQNIVKLENGDQYSANKINKLRFDNLTLDQNTQNKWIVKQPATTKLKTKQFSNGISYFKQKSSIGDDTYNLANFSQFSDNDSSIITPRLHASTAMKRNQFVNKDVNIYLSDKHKLTYIEEENLNYCSDISNILYNLGSTHHDDLVNQERPLKTSQTELKKHKESSSLYIDDSQLFLQIANYRQLRQMIKQNDEKQHQLQNKLAELTKDSHNQDIYSSSFLRNIFRKKTHQSNYSELSAKLALAESILRQHLRQNKQLEESKLKLMSQQKLSNVRQLTNTLDLHLVNQQLAGVDWVCRSLTNYAHETERLQRIMYSLQKCLGWVRVYATMYPTPHDSCLSLMSPNTLALHLPPRSSSTEQILIDNLLDKDKILFGLSRSHIIEGIEAASDRVLTCQLTQVLPPAGQQHALDLFTKHLETVVEAVAQGFNASVVFIGPTRTGKTTLMLGDEMLSEDTKCSDTAEASAKVEIWSEPDCDDNNNCDWSNCESHLSDEEDRLHLARYYGIVGLVLSYLIQLSRQKCLDSASKLLKITACLVEVQLEEQGRVVDLLSPGSTVTLPNLDEAKRLQIVNKADIIHLATMARRRQQCASSGFSPLSRSHLIVGIYVYDVNLRHMSGSLLLTDTVSLETKQMPDMLATDALNDNPVLLAWHDASCLVKAVASAKGSSGLSQKSLEHSSLLRLLRPCLVGSGSRQTNIIKQAKRTPICCLVFCLPCSRSELLSIVLCLRLMLLAMQGSSNSSRRCSSSTALARGKHSRRGAFGDDVKVCKRATTALA